MTTHWAAAATTALRFFWKAGWPFVLGYAVSAMIQDFVPKARLSRHLGKPSVGSISLATAFGAASSSCSFAALAAARSLVLKGAHFVAAVAFMFAGFVAVLVPASFWEAIFLKSAAKALPGWLLVLENAMVAPFVAAATFIGSMGSIPLATVLDANGVMFAGIMGFIYSDLMVPPLVAINARYYTGASPSTSPA